MTYRLQELIEHCHSRPELWHRISHTIQLSHDGQTVTISEPIAGLKPHQERTGEEIWPLWARVLRLLRRKAEIGVGDTAERLIGPRIGRLFKLFDCDCPCRKARLNIRFRY